MLTQKRLKELLHYDQEDGKFHWRVSTGRAKAGQEAGPVHIRIDGTLYKARRLAWVYVTGEMPKHRIINSNNNERDNRWSNLREITHSEVRLRSKTPFTNTSGIKGVSLCKRTMKYKAYITVEGKSVTLGTFDRKKDAAAAREQHWRLK